MRKVILGLVMLSAAGAAQAVTTLPKKSAAATAPHAKLLALKALPVILVPDVSSLPELEPDAVPVAAVVPEPSTWALLAVGFGLIGYGLRRRRIVAANVSA